MDGKIDQIKLQQAEAKFRRKISILSERLWSGSIKAPQIEEWLSNFDGRFLDAELEKVIALFWLSNFMYFGSREVRALLRSMYRDLLVPELVKLIYEGSPHAQEIEKQRLLVEELESTVFIGLGNPSESGAHLLYFFRQENKLSKSNFVDIRDIFRFERLSSQQGEAPGRAIRNLRNANIRNYVFIDDLCGSGEQLIDYSSDIVNTIKDIDREKRAFFIGMIGKKDGLDKARFNSKFDLIKSVYELDETFQLKDPNSRYFKTLPEIITPDNAISVIEGYGNMLNPSYSFGYKQSQMLLGFEHNIPDNCPAFIWYDSAFFKTFQEIKWTPIFKRYHKF